MRASPSRFLPSPCWRRARRGCAATASAAARGDALGQKSGGSGRTRRPPGSPAVAEQHRLPPDSTTKQTLALPGRTLAFTATAGSIRLFDDKGEPQADIAYTAYQLDGADPRHPAGDLPLQRRAGRGLGLSAIGRCRTVAAGHQRRRGDFVRVARSAAQRRDLARLHRSRLHRSGRHRLQPLRRHRRGRAQAVLLGRRRRQLDRGDDPPLAGKVRPPAVAEICRRRKLWRHPRTEDRPQSAARAGRRGEGPDPGFAGARLPRIYRLQHPAICRRAFRPWPRWRARRRAR